MTISASVVNQQITASVGETSIDVSVGGSALIDATVSGGFGPSGETGPPGTTSWTGIVDKPTQFSPELHAASHAIGGVDFIAPAAIGASTIDVAASLQLQVDGKAANNHTHAASAITSGTIASARLPNATASSSGAIIVGTGLSASSGVLSVTYGSSSSSACRGDDSRLSNSREWSASTVTQVEAEAGTDTTRVAWTVQRVWQAIAAWWNASAAKTKLDGIASGATANQTDAHLLGRANHTGTQTASTISDFTAAVVAAAPPTTDASLLSSGTLGADRLPLAAANTRGAVRIGSGISIDGDGVISASSGYALPTATDSVLGGVKIGAGVTITDGVISVSTNYAATSHAHAWSDITSGIPAALSGGYFAIDEDDFLCLRSLDISNPIRVETNAGAFGGFKLYSLDFYDPATDSFTTQTTAWTGGVDAANVTGLATVATSGSYDDLDDLPTLFDGAYSSLTGLPTLHDRSHAITSSSDHTATAWRVFYSNGSGQIVELALGAAGTVLTSGGASAAPTWEAGGGAVRSDTVSNVSYIGRALSGSATSASVWTIRRTNVASAGTVTTATAANVKWNDRLTASYS